MATVKKTATKPAAKKVVKKTTAPAKPKTTSGGKIGAKSITILWADGNGVGYDQFPKTYKTFAAARRALIPVYKDSVKSGRYNETQYKIVFDDNTSYKGAFGISPREVNPNMYKNVFEKYITDYIRYNLENPYSGFTDREKKKYADLIKNYKLTD